MGAFLVNVTTVGTFATSVGIATGNTLEALVGTLLINRYANGLLVFHGQRDTVNFVLLAALTSTMVSATVGVTTLSLGGYAEWNRFVDIWVTWWLGDAVAALILTPALLLWALHPTIPHDRSRLWETGLAWALLSLVTVLVFRTGHTMAAVNYPLEFLAFSLLIWIAVRLGAREAATAIVLCAGLAVWGTLRGTGPFSGARPHEALLALQAFMALIAVTTLGLAVGVSERARAEEALHELNQTLERRILDRTSTLQATVEQLQELNRLKTAFVSIVSHELRTPLTSIKGLTDNLMEGVAGEMGDKHRHYIARIQANADRLCRLLNELLDLSKIEAGRLQLHPTVLSLSELLHDVVEAFEPLARRKGIAIAVHAAPDMPKVQGDRDKLYEVLANLLENAIKFTPSEGRVDMTASVLDDRRIRVEVLDTGCGIPVEHLPRVFDKFYQVPSTPLNRGGAGLGLAIAKGLVELHGGTITAESGPGRGTRFSFTVPYETAVMV
jgi:signal transduction histidine kinase